jgi:hypothetical protein
MASAATVELGVPRDQSVVVRLFDQNGRVARHVFKGTVYAGNIGRWVIGTSSLAAGVYLIRAQGETFSDNKLIVISE